MKNIFIVIFVLFFSAQVFSQSSSIFIPKEFQAAYDKSTRSNTGEPGKAYWQNRADYNITAEINPSEAKITGSEEITYFNNSPDTLKSLVFHIYGNLYKKGSRSIMDISPEDLNDGVKIISMRAGGNVYQPDEQNCNGTILSVKLKKFIPPSSAEKIAFAWEILLPKKSWNKMGAYTPTDIFAGLWYPKVSVYDDIRKWDTEQYTGLAEFYNEYGNYDVKLILPEGYVCWATGELLNADKLFRNDIYERYNLAHKSDDIVHIITADDYNSGNITAPSSDCIWHFAAENVTDFAFGISNHFIFDGTSLNTGSKNVFVCAAYNPASTDFTEAAYIAKKSVKYYSDTFTGVEYSYPQITVFNGDDGMEYPMIINDGSFPSRGETVYVTSHEIHHQYFPFMVGTDETRFGWMDESFAVYVPEKFQDETEPSLNQQQKQKFFYSKAGGYLNDIPLMVPSFNLTPEQYFGTLYGKAERAMVSLEALIGRNKMQQAFKTFITEWQGKHPTPYDFFFTVEKVCGRNLSWFWKKWYFDYSYVSYEVKSAVPASKGYLLTVVNKGGAPAPYTITVNFEDGSSEYFSFPPFRGDSADVEITTNKKYKSATVY